MNGVLNSENETYMDGLSAVPGTCLRAGDSTHRQAAQAGKIDRMKTKKRGKTSNGSESIHHRSRKLRNTGDESH